MPLRKSPVSYQEFVETGEVRKKESATSPVEQAAESSAADPKPDLADLATATSPVAETGPEKQKRRAKIPVKPERGKNPGVLVTVDVPLPATGVSATFDTLCRSYSAKKALALILRKAMPEFERRLLDGKAKSAPRDYPIQPGDLKTTRTMPEDAYQLAKSQFDPLDMLPNRQFGRIVALAALAAFFKNEKSG
ncbi:VirC2 family conjugal transfer protein [Roseibium sediminicola]|uniref:VirC2 family conjugal transfer protein n=1 Tax=Roseibium sediminicola TaxID=2933272 RepID=A0ABT0H019_9HYPH|nr:VirC2 family conjugal transfer protein [Roseibium sp. CAU 1639]MCK7615032.1 VirC2 family conjugal transfer protein [Roseibium sp. CAU 1639]